METVSCQRAMSRRREGAKGRRDRRLRAEARIRLQLCRDAVRIASHRGGDGCRRAHIEASTQRAPVDEPPDFVTPAPAVPQPVVEDISPAPTVIQSPASAVSAAPAPVDEYVAPAPAVSAAPAPVDDFFAPAPADAVSAPVVEFIAPVPAVHAVPAPSVEYIAPAPAVYAAPAPVVELPPVPAVVQAPTSAVENIAPAPAVLLAPVVKSLSPVPAVSRSQAPGQSSTSRRGHDLPLLYGCLRAEDASGRVYFWHVHTRQTRWTPPVSEDEVEYEEDEEDEEDEDEEDEDMDEIYAESRFPAGFLPMRMCRWFSSWNCRQGWGCMFAHSVSELHTLARGQGP